MSCVFVVAVVVMVFVAVVVETISLLMRIVFDLSVSLRLYLVEIQNLVCQTDP